LIFPALLPQSTLFPYTTLFRSTQVSIVSNDGTVAEDSVLITYKPDGQLYSPLFVPGSYFSGTPYFYIGDTLPPMAPGSSMQFFIDRKSTRLNSSHVSISYAVFC